MPTYVYSCGDDEHPKVTITHSFHENPVIKCTICHKVMHRVPQPFKFYMNPYDTLYKKMDDNFREYKQKSKMRNK